jgi:aflatoxin B1 aldehyde reductase
MLMGLSLIIRSHSSFADTPLSPLAGGFLTGKVSIKKPETNLSGGRWAPGAFPLYPDVFDKPSVHAAVRKFYYHCEDNNISSTEASLRWLVYHSALREGDGIIIGATRVDQLKGNLEISRKGPLDEEIVKAVEELWESVRGEIHWPATNDKPRS